MNLLNQIYHVSPILTANFALFLSCVIANGITLAEHVVVDGLGQLRCKLTLFGIDFGELI